MADAAQSETKSLQRDFSRFKVLIVEDSEVTWRLAHKVLSDIGVTEILWTADTDNGYADFCKHKPDVVFIDWDTEDDKGLTLGRKIKEDPASPNRDARIILSVAFADRERILEAVQAGFMNILAKPVSINSLKKQLLKALEEI